MPPVHENPCYAPALEPLPDQFVRMGRKHVDSYRCHRANRKCIICSAYEPCYAIISFRRFQWFGVLVDCSEAEISRSGDFCADRQTMTDKTDCFTLCACAWGSYYLAVLNKLPVILVNLCSSVISDIPWFFDSHSRSLSVTNTHVHMHINSHSWIHPCGRYRHIR